MLHSDEAECHALLVVPRATEFLEEARLLPIVFAKVRSAVGGGDAAAADFAADEGTAIVGIAGRVRRGAYLQTLLDHQLCLRRAHLCATRDVCFLRGYWFCGGETSPECAAVYLTSGESHSWHRRARRSVWAVHRKSTGNAAYVPIWDSCTRKWIRWRAMT